MKAEHRYFVTEAEREEAIQRERPIAWFVWLLLIVLPPAGIFLLWKRKGHAGIWTKAILTIADVCWMKLYFSTLLRMVLYFGADRTVGIFRF